MPKLSLCIRSLFLEDRVLENMRSKITTDRKVTPGQIRERAGWYFLTYLRLVKVKTFDIEIWDLSSTEVETIRVVPFQIRNGKLLIRGSVADIKEIIAYLDAIVLEVSGSKDETEINFNDYYRMDILIIDFDVLLSKFEDGGLVESVRKVKMANMEVNLGTIPSCLVKTQNYDCVKKAILEEQEKIAGMEIFLRQPEKTSVYYGIDGMVKVQSKADVDVEELTVNFALLLSASATAAAAGGSAD